MNDEERQKQLYKDCDNYDQSVSAIKALSHELVWDDKLRQPFADASVSIGRRMRTSPANRIRPDTDVTPDIVLRCGMSGYVAEAKITLPSDPSLREKDLLDLQKYDDQLSGWDKHDGQIVNHDLILIVHKFIGSNIKEQLAALERATKLTWTRKFALVAFSIVEQSDTWLSLEMLSGAISDSTKHQKLDRTLPIKLEHAVSNSRFMHIQLYDAKPPLPLLMKLIHQLILSRLTHDNHLALRTEGSVRYPCTVDLLKDSLAKAFGPGQASERTPEIPKKKWVAEALEQFVKLGWADENADEVESFHYIVKRRRGEFDQFIRHCARSSVSSETGQSTQKDEPEAQLSFEFKSPS